MNGGQIPRATLDGTSIDQSFITQDLRVFDPAAIAVVSGRIYWSGLNNNSIGHAKTDGTGILNNLVTGADEGGPQGIAITGSALRTASAGPGALDFGRRPHRTRARPSHSPSPIRDRATEDLLRTERNA